MAPKEYEVDEKHLEHVCDRNYYSFSMLILVSSTIMAEMEVSMSPLSWTQMSLVPQLVRKRRRTRRPKEWFARSTSDFSQSSQLYVSTHTLNEHMVVQAWIYVLEWLRCFFSPKLNDCD
jgi:hypothetical protein